MAITNTVAEVRLPGDGVNFDFDLGMEVAAKTELVVSAYDSVTEVETALVVDVDYTVSNLGEDTGVTITYPLSGSAIASTVFLIAIRRSSDLQGQTLRIQGGFDPNAVMSEMDRLTLRVQELQAKLDRAVLVPIGKSGGTFAQSETPAGSFMALNSSWQPTLAELVAGTFAASAFGQDLFVAANAVAVLAELGITATPTELNQLDGITVLSDTAINAAIAAAVSGSNLNAQTVVATTGSSNAYVMSAAETISGYTTGQKFLLRINHENTGAVTINIDGQGTKDVQKYNSSNALVALDAGDFRIGSIHGIVYDGTRFLLLTTAPGNLIDDNVIGIDQTWQDVSGSRAHSTSYRNETGKPIQVAIAGRSTGVKRDIQTSPDNSTWVTVGYMPDNSGVAASASFVVPDDDYYRVNGNIDGGFAWSELR